MSSVEFTDKRLRFYSRYKSGREAGLIAAAQILVNVVARKLRGGYTSGTFVTGNVMASVTKSQPYPDGEGMSINVGTNVRYALFWELGHHNIFTRKYERVPIWQPAAEECGPDCAAAFTRVANRHIEAGGL